MTKIAKKWVQKQFFVDFSGKYASNVNKNNGIGKHLKRDLKYNKYHQNPITIGDFEVHTASGAIMSNLITPDSL